jgi:hypothetical protein
VNSYINEKKYSASNVTQNEYEESNQNGLKQRNDQDNDDSIEVKSINILDDLEILYCQCKILIPTSISIGFNSRQ